MKEFCTECMEERHIKISNAKEKVNVKGDQFTIELKIPVCEVCSHEVFIKKIEKENDRIVYDMYRRRNHLLTTIEIKDIRDSLGLTQKEFSNILGFGEKTITRYENGSIQDVAHDNLMRLYSKSSNVGMIWNIRKTEFSEKENTALQFALSTNRDISFTYKVEKSPFFMDQYQYIDFDEMSVGRDKYER